MDTGAIRRNIPIAMLGVSALGLGAAAVALGNGEAVVERGFQRAIASMDGKSTSNRAMPVIAGSEEFWLTHVVHDAGSPTAAKPVTVGDRITISSKGNQRVLNVVTVDRLDSQVLPISSERPTRMLLVTCRDEANPQSRPIRFLVEDGDEIPALSSAKARTL
ncbi:MAG: hypothetical protein WC829_08455 [Hyphomicrobium sp.]|jgi:hypothetical protein